MAALLVGLGVMCALLIVASPVWRTAMQREREAELVFRGEQYARAIALFQRAYGGTYPPSIDALVKGRFLRRRYLDPMTGGEFRLLYAGAPASSSRGDGAKVQLGADPRWGIVGVASRSTHPSLRYYNGKRRYDQWYFLAGSVHIQNERQVGSRNRQSPPRPD